MRATLLLILLLPIFSQAQEQMGEPSKATYLGFNVGIVGMNLQDHLVMPRRYHGTNAFYGLSYKRKNPKSRAELNVLGTVGRVSPEQINLEQNQSRFRQPSAQLYYFRLDYSRLYLVKQWTRSSLHLGAAADFFINVRFSERWDNSAINYEGSLAPLILQGSIDKKITIGKKGLLADFRLQVPTIMYVLRPPFSGVPDFLDHEENFLRQIVSPENSTWSAIWDFPHVRSRLAVQMPIRGSNVLEVSYWWEYYSYQKPLKTQAGTHLYLLTLLTHL